MWLTRAVMAVRRRVMSSKHTPGRQFIGKHRKYRPITENMVRSFLKRLEVQKENEKHLSKPYLTPAEEIGHAKEQNDREFQEFLEKRRAASIKPHRYMVDHFSHLKHGSHW